MTERNRKNKDPISGEEGSHPIGTGAGAAAGGAAGAAAGAAAGPAGSATGATIGAVAGAVGGGLAGRTAAEAINPTEEEAYWEKHFNSRHYRREGEKNSDYKSGYQCGVEGYRHYAGENKRFEDVENDLRSTYESENPGFPWEQGRYAARDAWHKLEHNLERLIGFAVVDREDNKIGKVSNVLEDHTGQPAFLGVKTGWLGMGKQHVLPVGATEISEASRRIRVPFEADVVKNAPYFDEQDDIDAVAERSIYNYYGLEPGDQDEQEVSQEFGQDVEGKEAAEGDNIRVQLKSEEMKVDKREVEGGGVRLKKIVRIETVNQPVELIHEEIEIERVPASEAADTDEDFGEQDIYIPLRREEPVIQKQARVREEVHIKKKAQTQKQNVPGTVRHEDVDIQKGSEDKPQKEEASERHDIGMDEID